ncbi:hypothetical protein GE061_017847 [Apolygus lucorum]|uniref:Uncharacterized protein n=1 Tax=Apolygus lucorum TaxID=248454 RepID=A0A8S9XE83_APOLU|nr:hypothetical protein GE061_017847 [Apolygus lucorum]
MMIPSFLYAILKKWVVGCDKKPFSHEMRKTKLILNNLSRTLGRVDVNKIPTERSVLVIHYQGITKRGLQQYRNILF